MTFRVCNTQEANLTQEAQSYLVEHCCLSASSLMANGQICLKMRDVGQFKGWTQ